MGKSLDSYLLLALEVRSCFIFTIPTQPKMFDCVRPFFLHYKHPLNLSKGNVPENMFHHFPRISLSCWLVVPWYKLSMLSWFMTLHLFWDGKWYLPQLSDLAYSLVLTWQLDMKIVHELMPGHVEEVQLSLSQPRHPKQGRRTRFGAERQASTHAWYWRTTLNVQDFLKLELWDPCVDKDLALVPVCLPTRANWTATSL